jgi:hypothetical protein
VRPFKGIICDDISEFESFHASTRMDLASRSAILAYDRSHWVRCPLFGGHRRIWGKPQALMRIAPQLLAKLVALDLAGRRARQIVGHFESPRPLVGRQGLRQPFAKSWRRPAREPAPAARQAGTEPEKFPRYLLITGAVVEPLDHVAE